MQHYIYKLNIKLRTQLLAQGFERLPHALLLAGPAGLGKREFAENLAASLLCEAGTPEFDACGTCPSCRWLMAGSHPDFRCVAPAGDEGAEEGATEKAKKRSPGSIRIDQIRELEDFVFVGSHRQANRVVLLTEAESMNPAAANALLKILEEPPSSVYFLIVSSNIKNLLPTLRSRCRVVSFTTPEKAVAAEFLGAAGLEKQATRYLALAGGAPLQVMQWKSEGQLTAIDTLVESLIAPLSDPIQLAARWDALLKNENAFRLEHLVTGIQRWLFDLALERMSGEVHYHGDWPRPKDIAALDPLALLAAWRELLPLRRSARHPLNPLLFMEMLAFYTLRALRPATR